MAKIIHPQELIGYREKSFDPKCWWVITDYDPEEREFVMTKCQFRYDMMLHPNCPNILALDTAPTKRVSEFEYL